MDRRSDCPISYALDHFGDRWSLLVVRDLTLKGRTSFTELREAGEGIARNILADRLARLEAAHIIQKVKDPTDGRRRIYRMTEKGLDLIPVLLEMIRWSARHDAKTAVPPSFIAELEADREQLIQRLRNQTEA